MHDDENERNPAQSASRNGALADELDPVDRAWIARRSAVAPLVLGLVSVALSPLLLGLLFGPLGMRAGVDLWRHGTRRAAVAGAIALGFAGTVASIVGAVLWGSILASVLLGRDAMREAERWTGRDVSTATVEFLVAVGSEQNAAIALNAPIPPRDRWAILFADEGSEPCMAAAATLAECAKNEPSVLAFAAVQPESREALATRFALAGIDLPVAMVKAVPPLDAIAAMPTLVVVDRRGRIEKALVGAHPRADIEALLRGDAALPERSAASRADIVPSSDPAVSRSDDAQRR